MKKYRFHGLAILAILLLSAALAYTHSGRTDKNGGHYNRKTGEYHYHNSGTVPRTSRTLPRAPDTNLLSTREWERPYSPTRIEWLTLQLNARYSYPLIAKSGVLLGQFSFWNTKDNVITITLRYTPIATDATKTQMMAQAKKFVIALAKTYGWERWIKIEEKFEEMGFL